MTLRRERFRLRGRVLDENFAPWISRHGSRLGLVCTDPQRVGDGVEFEATGEPDLLDAMELGCSLGPIEVDVRTVDRVVLPRTD